MQKNLPVFIVLCLFSTAINAQIKKGTIFLGGQAGFSKQTSSTNGSPASKESNFTITPAIGKFIKDNLVVGADITYSHYKSDNSYTAKSNQYGLGLFIRQYKELGKGFYLFGQARAGGNYYKQDMRDFNNFPAINTNKGYSLQLAAYPGIAYQLSKKFQLETGFSNLIYAEFDHSIATTSANGLSETKNGFSLGTSLSGSSWLTIGFRVLLN